MEHVRSGRALLVESHDLLAQTVTKALRGEGIEVDRASSSSAAQILDAADEGRHGLVVLDADRAGEGDDIDELIAQLHARGLVVVVLTDSAQVARSALDRGATRVICPDQGAAGFREALGIQARQA